MVRISSDDSSRHADDATSMNVPSPSSHGTIRKLAGIGAVFAALIMLVVASIVGVLVFRAGRRVGLVGAVVWLFGDVLHDTGYRSGRPPCGDVCGRHAGHERLGMRRTEHRLPGAFAKYPAS